MHISNGNENEIVTTPIKNPIAMKVETTDKTVPTVRQTHATHSKQELFARIPTHVRPS